MREFSETKSGDSSLLMSSDGVPCNIRGDNAVTLSIKQIILFKGMAFKSSLSDAMEDMILLIKIGDS